MRRPPRPVDQPTASPGLGLLKGSWQEPECCHVGEQHGRQNPGGVVAMPGPGELGVSQTIDCSVPGRSTSSAPAMWSARSWPWENGTKAEFRRCRTPARARWSAAMAPGAQRPAETSPTTGETAHRRSGSAPCSPPWPRCPQLPEPLQARIKDLARQTDVEANDPRESAEAAEVQGNSGVFSDKVHVAEASNGRHDVGRTVPEDLIADSILAQARVAGPRPHRPSPTRTRSRTILDRRAGLPASPPAKTKAAPK
jgi:hypothetical protein